MTRQATLYRRVSTLDQEREGTSLDSQHEALLRYCAQHGLTVGGSWKDASSGRTQKKRWGLAQALKEVTEVRGVLVVYSLSRLARSIIDAATILQQLRAAGADLAIVDNQIDTTNIYGELTFNLIASIAQFESQMIGERIRTANTHTQKANYGWRTQGQPRYGWRRKDGQWVEEPTEQATIREIEACLADGLCMDDVCEFLHWKGMLHRGKPWHRYAIMRVLKGAKEARKILAKLAAREGSV